MKEQKKEILIILKNFIDKYSLEGELDKVCEYIKSLPSKAMELNNELKQAHKFLIKRDTESYYGEDGYYEVFHLHCYRWETDDEFTARIELNKKKSKAAKEREKHKKEIKLKREKTLYENLKKKFEDI